jgi:hypothetical protein
MPRRLILTSTERASQYALPENQDDLILFKVSEGWSFVRFDDMMV